MQDVIDGVNYENTGELGAEMGGKPVQHGTDVPPNAVRAGPLIACQKAMSINIASVARHCAHGPE